MEQHQPRRRRVSDATTYDGGGDLDSDDQQHRRHRQSRSAAHHDEFPTSSFGILSGVLQLFRPSTQPLVDEPFEPAPSYDGRPQPLRQTSWFGRQITRSVAARKPLGTPGFRARKEAITAHVTSVLQRRIFICKLAQALLAFGAPSHRLEGQLEATAKALDIDAAFIHLPSTLMVSFGDSAASVSETRFIKADGRINLGSLHETHEVFRCVTHGVTSPVDGTVALTKLLHAPPLRSDVQRIMIASVYAMSICLLAYAGTSGPRFNHTTYTGNAQIQRQPFGWGACASGR